MESPVIHVVGGVYEERCMRPAWHEVFGSAGRAASAITAMRGPNSVALHCHVDDGTLPAVQARCHLEGIEQNLMAVEQVAAFSYVHGLSAPTVRRPVANVPALNVHADCVLVFGTMEGQPIVHGKRVVYDPQSSSASVLFGANGSTAGELAIVLNEREARSLTDLQVSSIQDLAAAAQQVVGASVVVIKQGPLGAFVWGSQEQGFVPAFRTSAVWKIGSGDVFSAHFAHGWAVDRMSALESAAQASRATAVFCETGGFPTPKLLVSSRHKPIVTSPRYQAGYRPSVYLAGPFFTLAQLWLVEQVRANLLELGLRVFSPYHDVGYGSAAQVVHADLDGVRNSDLVFAIVDGLDSGTVYEIGYARALGVPVVVYSENEVSENLKMMEGSGCELCADYVTSIYHAFWQAAAQ